MLLGRLAPTKCAGSACRDRGGSGGEGAPATAIPATAQAIRPLTRDVDLAGRRHVHFADSIQHAVVSALPKGGRDGPNRGCHSSPCCLAGPASRTAPRSTTPQALGTWRVWRR